MGTGPQFFLFLPQLRFTMPDLVDRARAAEAAGFTGIALMDHLSPPLAEDRPMLEAMTAATWLAAATTTLTVSHLVLCDAFRQPAVLARQAVTLDHASGGRFELGIGAGSVPAEFAAFGIANPGRAARVRRLGESLEVLTRLWSGDPIDFEGEFHSLKGAQQVPAPLSRIPIVIGGTSDEVVALAAKYADWWNMPTYPPADVTERAARAAPARASVQQIVAFVADEASRSETADLARRRFGGMRGSAPLVGDATELRDAFAASHAQGVERVYLWFADFAAPATLEAFGAGVIAAT